MSIVDGASMRLDAPAANLCGVGAQPGDIARLIGCTGNGDCAIDETCYIHPQAVGGINGVTGMCVPSDRVIEFSADCQSLLTTVRRYSVVDVADDHVVFATRPRTMPETPIDGCTDTPQCTALQEKVLSAREDAAGQPRNTLTRYAFTCETDDIMGGPKRCIEVCGAQNACEPGTTCERISGRAMDRCVLGPIPPPKCIAPLQRYELRAGDAFTVVSSVAGYRHRGTVDPDTKACLVDPDKSSLLVARFGRNEPACGDTSVTAISPNPCTLPLAVINDNDCTDVVSGFAEPIVVSGALCYRPTHAVRIRTPGLSFDVVDLSLALPLEGYPDVRYSPIQFGYAFQLQVAAGDFPFIETSVRANLPTRLRHGLNNEPWVVDSGDSGVVNGTQGQIIFLSGNPASDATNFKLF